MQATNLECNLSGLLRCCLLPPCRAHVQFVPGLKSYSEGYILKHIYIIFFFAILATVGRGGKCFRTNLLKCTSRRSERGELALANSSRGELQISVPNFTGILTRRETGVCWRRCLGVALIHRRSKQYVGVRVKGSYSVACVWKISYPLSYLGYVNFSVGRGADARVQYAPV